MSALHRLPLSAALATAALLAACIQQPPEDPPAQSQAPEPVPAAVAPAEKPLSAAPAQAARNEDPELAKHMQTPEFRREYRTKQEQLQAEALVRSGSARHVLVIGAETLSQMTDIHDRGTAFIFADGAGAVIVGPSETNGIGPVVWGSDGENAPVIVQTAEWSEAVDTQQHPYIHMNGQAVFRWATGFPKAA